MPSPSILTSIPISRTICRPKTTYRTRRGFAISFPRTIIRRLRLTPELFPIEIDALEKIGMVKTYQHRKT